MTIKTGLSAMGAAQKISKFVKFTAVAVQVVVALLMAKTIYETVKGK
jgi:hypothetical protein